MSVAYNTTSFGTTHPHPSAPSYPPAGSAREQRQSSGSSRSSDTFATAASNQGLLPLPVTSNPPTRSGYSESAMRLQYDQIGAFFGGGREPERSGDVNTERGRSDSDRDRASATTGPPSYDTHNDAGAESLPTYTKTEEYHSSLNRKLFIYGFLFFPLWIVGIIAPFIKPLQDPTRDNRSKEDKESDLATIRKAELRWAWRCGFALLGFVTLVITAVVIGVVVANN